MCNKTLVIGLGNPLRGDDGIGVRVVEALRARTLPENVEVVDGGTQGLGIVPLLAERQRVIFVDAADLSHEPGYFARFTPDEVRLLSRERRISIHEAGLRDALVLAEALHALPKEIVIFGVQPAKLDWDSSLSPQVEAVLPELVEAVLKEIMESDRLSQDNRTSY